MQIDFEDLEVYSNTESAAERVFVFKKRTVPVGVRQQLQQLQGERSIVHGVASGVIELI
jgi:hypothetical protein